MPSHAKKNPSNAVLIVITSVISGPTALINPENKELTTLLSSRNTLPHPTYFLSNTILGN